MKSKKSKKWKRPKKVNILGTTYKIIYNGKDGRLKGTSVASHDRFVKEIIMEDKSYFKETESTCRNLIALEKQTLRHEIIHAFLYESGLSHNANSSNCWALNEEMVDWIAIQFPNIYKVFKKLNIHKD